MSTQFTVKTTDMSARESGFVSEAGSLLLEKLLKEHKPKKKSKTDELEKEFVQTLKVVLDQRFGPEWTVVGGFDFGFALKSRKNSAVVMNGNLFGKNFQVVAYRSPGHEIFSNSVVAAIAQRKIRNIPKISPNDISDLLTSDAPDHQGKAQKIRDSLSAATETPIWHVVVGTNFRVSFPNNYSHEFTTTITTTPTTLTTTNPTTVTTTVASKVVVFRHSQETERKLISYLPMISKVVMVLFCLALLFQSRLGLSDRLVQAGGVGVLALAVMKVLYAVLFEKKRK